MNGARLQSLDSLLQLRAAVWKFVEAATAVLNDSECELQRTQNWLETEADFHWRGEIRKRQEEIVRAKAALRSKKMFKSDLSQRSVVEEEKALRMAEARLREAEKTLEAVRRYRVVLQKETDQYKGQVSRLAGSVAVDLPMAAAKLDALLQHLQAYVGLKPEEAAAAGAPEPGLAQGAGEDLPSMARAEPAGPDREGEDHPSPGEHADVRPAAPQPGALGSPSEDTHGAL